MVYTTFTDGVDPWSADDYAALQDQTVVPFASTTARDAAVADPPSGMVTYIIDTTATEQWSGTEWKVIASHPLQLALGLSAVITTDSSAANADLLGSLPLKANSTYHVRAVVKLTAGTAKMTTTGTGLTGLWGNTRNGTDAALFDKTSADAIIDLASGFQILEGDVTTGGSDVSWGIWVYAGTSSAQVAAGSYIEAKKGN